MKMLECIIVYGYIPLVFSLASLSLTCHPDDLICTILMMFVTARLLSNEVDCYKYVNMQWQNNDSEAR